MRVLALKALRRFWEKHPHAESPLRTWYKVTTKARWGTLSDLKATFPATDHIAGEHVVFDVHRNKIRISANVDFRFGFVFIREVMTHDEYQRATKEWRGKLRRKKRE